MSPMLAGLGFALAALCAGVMGFAIQRGGTCTVAAVEEIVDKHSARRLLALGEASLWVAGGLLLAQAMHMLPALAMRSAAGRLRGARCWASAPGSTAPACSAPSRGWVRASGAMR